MCAGQIFKNEDKRENITYQFKLKPLSKNQTPKTTPLIYHAVFAGASKLRK